MMIRKLNILMKYPISWGVYSVMNNFVQNFYDAVGPENFATGFKMDYKDNTLTLEANSGFNKEWLYYLGASTKRDDGKNHAGHFGEGFKMAALVAYRDLKLGITMESQDWRLIVTQADQIINDLNEKVLAYDICSRPYSDNTKLTLTGVTSEQYKEACYSINSFYYEENPRFGKPIIKTDEFAVYKSNSKKNNGGIFINLEFRRVFPFPIYFCIHNMNIDKDDRDRTSVSCYMMQRAVELILDKLNNALAAMEILELFSPIWLTLQDVRYRRKWDYEIKKLIEIIADDKDVRDKFYKKYKDTLIAEISPMYPCDKIQRKTALSWYRYSSYNSMRRVSHYFTKLGIKDMYTLCKENGGLDITASPNDKQSVRIKILEEAAYRFFSSLYCYEKLPICKVLVNINTAALGKAYTYKTQSVNKNTFGVKVAYDIDEVFLAKETLDNASFYSALPVYIHELLHQFGGDSSECFHSMLYEMNKIIMENRKELIKYAERW